MFIIRAILIAVAIFIGSIVIGWLIVGIAAVVKQSIKLIYSGLKFVFQKRTKELGDV